MPDFRDHLTIHNIVVIILVIIGLIWLIHGIWRNMKVNSISSWPKINATVINDAVMPTSGRRDNTFIDPRYIPATSNNKKMYVPSILYKYNINGREYQSSNLVYAGSKTYNAVSIRNMMSQMYPGATIQVFYNPGNYGESYVYTGVKSYFNIILGIILLLIAAYIGYDHNVSHKYFVEKTSVKEINLETPKAFYKHPRSKRSYY